MCVLVPDLLVIVSHLNWLVTSALNFNSCLRFEIAWGVPGVGPNRARTFRLDEVSTAGEFAVRLNRAGCNVYVGVTLKNVETPSEGRTRGSNAALAVCLPVDIDKDFHPGLLKLEDVVKPQVIVMTGGAPEPRGQAWVRTELTNEMELWKEANRRSVYFCGGDPNALGTYRLMRLAGTVSYPSPEKQRRGYVTELTTATYYDAPTYRLEDLLNSLPPLSGQDSIPSTPRLNSNQSMRLIPVNLTNVAIIQSMCDALPDNYVFEHDLWVRVGFALNSFEAGEIGLALWMKFSERAPQKFAKTNFVRAWGYIGRPYEGKKITRGWLRHHATQHGWKQPCPWDFSSLLGLDEVVE